jgi:hypothetical protein
MFRKALMICAMTGALGLAVIPANARIYVGLGVGVPPPAPVVQAPPPAPGPGYVWTPGYYNWNGSSYVWVNGQWMLPPAHYHTFVAGQWVHRHHKYYYRQGYWRH